MVGGDWNQGPSSRNYLGLALLDKDLKMIQDVVIRAPDILIKFVDFRLFVLKGTLYLTSNCQMVRLWINPSESTTNLIRVSVFPNKFPSPLTVAMGNNPSVCSRSMPELQGAKNLNYFVDANGKAVVEFQPASPRDVRIIKPNLPDFPNGPGPNEIFTDNSASVLQSPSFFTLEELDLANRRGFYGQAFTGYRGSACCEFVDTPQQQKVLTNSSQLLLGIAHVKTPYGRKKLQGVVTPNQYLSRFYAFEPTPPYRLVAQSGYFCLPANPPSNNNNRNPMAAIPTQNPLDIGDTIYNCPKIHFISGMVAKVGDNTKLIIAYGVDDCTSWFIEVDKRQVVDLLFGPPQGH